MTQKASYTYARFPNAFTYLLLACILRTMYQHISNKCHFGPTICKLSIDNTNALKNSVMRKKNQGKKLIWLKFLDFTIKLSRTKLVLYSKE